MSIKCPKCGSGNLFTGTACVAKMFKCLHCQTEWEPTPEEIKYLSGPQTDAERLAEIEAFNKEYWHQGDPEGVSVEQGRMIDWLIGKLKAAQIMRDKPYYYLFAGEEYDPLGGVRDLKGYYVSLEAAMSKLIIAESGKNAHLVDQSQKLVEWAHIATQNNEGALVIVAYWDNLDYPGGITDVSGNCILEPTDNKHWHFGVRDSR